MQRFIHTENLKRFHELLSREADPQRRTLLQRLIDEEEHREFSKPDGQGSSDGQTKP